MSINAREPLDYRMDPGPYLGVVTSQIDPTFMGSLRVNIMRISPERDDVLSSGVIVRYCSPFFGSTAQKYEGNNSSSFNDVQKSYGFWMVPPDIGCTVMVVFIGGDINQGYWFGCIPDRYQDQMVPGIAASQYSAMTPEQLRQYGTQNVPVAEFLKSSRDMTVPDPSTFTKPVHPFADRLVQQGLLIDDVRGVTSSSARREVPSGVFGISTPGPIDTTSPLKPVGFTQDNAGFAMPVSRLGGHQFVMDDGDKDGKNELFRIRTRTGHQILLHNSSDLIYIANSKGTAWIELTSNGKIDMYAEDSVSIHTMQDFNFLAERDFNLECKRDMNISVGNNYQIDVLNDYVVNSGRNGILSFEHNLDINASSTIAMSSEGDIHIKSADIFESASGGFNMTAGAAWAVSAGNSNITSGSHKETAGTIDMNGPAASPAAGATAAVTATPLPTFTLPNRVATSGWSNKQFYKASDLVTIMKRAPTHEPWDHHENVNPNSFSSTSTDIYTGGANTGVEYKIPPAVGTPPKKTGNVVEDNKAAFLWALRCCEGTSNGNGYQQIYGVNNFFSVTDSNLSTYKFKDHPRLRFPSKLHGNPSTTSAAGAYQFEIGTWDRVQRAIKLPDFSPHSQDLAALYLIKGRHALDYVISGNITEAVHRLHPEWASLPGSTAGQGGKSLAAVETYYKQGGGVLNA